MKHQPPKKNQIYFLKKSQLNIKEKRGVFKRIKDSQYLCNQVFLSHIDQGVFKNFRSSWFKVTDEFNISTTIKINIILDYSEDYFEEYCDLTNITLQDYKVTDKLCDKMHQVLNKMDTKCVYYVI